ncbi:MULTISPECIES: phage portal protein [Actinomadura]|uniref:Phage portal protein n=1 Tax=Actinomadura yumaensis TaxID=111807 RepID=A0ABW2CWG6_9ACTN|nr:phage portal protein [Actinomadura sp. J1-007]
MALEEHESVGTPDWWLLRLGRRLTDRQPNLRVWWDYYRGEPPLPQGPKKESEAYRDFQRKARSNFCLEVADSSVNRLRVIGIADGEGRPDTEAWRWWQANRLDARQAVLWRTALALSEAYLMVGPHPRDERRPLITLEHPRETIVEHDPATGERLAALKAWYDDVAGVARATVYLPDQLVRYETSSRGRGPMRWGPKIWTRLQGPDGGGPHQLGSVPVVPFACRPFLGEDPVAEFDNVIDIQDRINLGVLNRMTIERYSAFRQRWIRGHKFRKVTDPETGLQTVEQPFKPGPGAVWASEFENAQFGDFQQSQIDDLLRAHETDIRDLLIISRTPAYTYAGNLVNISPDTIEALDVSHVAKVEEHQANFGEGLEETLGMAARIAGVERDFTAAEVRWRNPRLINPAVAADAATKKKAIGYPLAVIAEDMGESPQRVQRIVSEAAADQLAGAQALQMAADATAQAQTPARPPVGATGDGGDDGGA